MLDQATDALNSTSGTVSLNGTNPADALAANTERNGAGLAADAANTQPVYVRYHPTADASATVFHAVIPAGSSIRVEVGRVVYAGRVSLFSAAAAKVGVTEA